MIRRFLGKFLIPKRYLRISDTVKVGEMLSGRFCDRRIDDRGGLLFYVDGFSESGLPVLRYQAITLFYDPPADYSEFSYVNVERSRSDCMYVKIYGAKMLLERTDEQSKQ